MRQEIDFICKQCNLEFKVPGNPSASVHGAECPACSSKDVKRQWCRNMHYHPTKGK